jgi:transcriptional regulator with XRE-family HTH domain
MYHKRRYRLVILENLKRTRERYPLTLRELETKSGVSKTTINKLENLRQNARPSTIRKLAEALGVEPKELMKGEE